LKKFLLPHFQVTIRANGGESKDEVRVLVTKKIRRAVDRNRVKRVVREFFRKEFLRLETQKGFGTLVICRVSLGKETAGIKNVQLFEELRKIIPKSA
jgi:ribonuclease P protein component